MTFCLSYTRDSFLKDDPETNKLRPSPALHDLLPLLPLQIANTHNQLVSMLLLIVFARVFRFVFQAAAYWRRDCSDLRMEIDAATTVTGS